MALIDDLKWRYATKKMSGEAVPQEKVDYIIEAARLAPSSSGLQPYKILVITNPELKQQILPIANNQKQVVDGSHLLVWVAWDSYSHEKIGDVFAHTVNERGLKATAMDEYHKRLWGAYEPLGKEWQHHHIAKQAYISLGLAMAAAAEQRVDATPMEGFKPRELDELLGLQEQGLKSVLLLPLGYRDTEEDWLAKMKKVRTPQDDFVTVLS